MPAAQRRSVVTNRRLTQRQRARIQRQQDHRRERAEGPTPTPTPDEVGLGSERTGLVIANHGSVLIVEDDEDRLYRCAARQNLGRLACGDRVVWQPSGAEAGVGVVVALIERRSLLTRPDHRGQPRPVAANLDEVAVVLAPEPEPSEYLLDRYLVAIAAIGVRGLLVLNKADLLDASARAALLDRLEPYQRIGYPLLLASNRAARGLDELRAWLGGRVSLLVGQSGVGKSSLVKALLPEREIRIRAISQATGHGAHTTTTSTLYHLPDGGDLIDTPGVRSFGLGEIDPDALGRGFPELAPYLGHCRFSDCRHQGEPGCELAAALARGEIVPRRLDSYVMLRAELAARLARPG
ncbi:MAG: small ribosomal subunit biogenesis GTPase RsgA [Candidatus Competibacter sp.]|nr:small ribosomal subunit biogenesis GTPase RsgA [Candidatus Competibacter sp.]